MRISQDQKQSFFALDCNNERANDFVINNSCRVLRFESKRESGTSFSNIKFYFKQNKFDIYNYY